MLLIMIYKQKYTTGLHSFKVISNCLSFVWHDTDMLQDHHQSLQEKKKKKKKLQSLMTEVEGIKRKEDSQQTENQQIKMQTNSNSVTNMLQ